MAQLIEVFGFVSVILRGCTLALQSLLAGGVVFALFILKQSDTRVRRGIRLWACALAATQVLFVAADSVMLAGTSGFTLLDLIGANYFIAGCAIVAASLSLAAMPVTRAMLLPVSVLFAGTLATSHAMARLDNRVLLGVLTVIHQAATAVWVGTLPYLIAARRPASDPVWRRFSLLALASVLCLAIAGVGLSYFYVGHTRALYGTVYGVMVLAKVLLFGILLLLGYVNYAGVRQGNILNRLRAVGEAEIGIGFCVIFAAASLTSQPPAIDVVSTTVPANVVIERVTPQVPRLTTPPVSDQHLPGIQRTQVDFAWSEYNHHWAGLVVLAMGVLAAVARSGKAHWARNWPVLFVGLGVFLLLRADFEVWPLGPYGFWESLKSAEVLQHRLAVLLVFAFAAFEWGVQTGRLTSMRAALVFPGVCALGGALLLTHSHSLTNVQEELLAELSHVPLALFGIAAGWARWLELRLPPTDRRWAAAVWPVCFSMVGVVLLLYREM